MAAVDSVARRHRTAFGVELVFVNEIAAFVVALAAGKRFRLGHRLCASEYAVVHAPPLDDVGDGFSLHGEGVARAGAGAGEEV